MRHFLFLSLLFLPIVTNGQTKSDISLINDVLFETPYIDGNSYIQLDNKIHPCILNWDFEDYYSELKNHLDKKKLHELIRNANKAMSIDGEWKPNEIKNTIILSDTEITQLQLSNQNGVTKRLTQFYYVLSIPIYDETENYAVIRFGGGSARNNMVGSYFLLKIVKDKWIIITSFSSWAS